MPTKLAFPRLTSSFFPADLAVALIAASLPWSTSLPAIFVGFWLLALIPLIDVREFSQLAKHPACFLPIAFSLLAMAGMFWSTSPWSARFYSLGPLAKLLAIPVLIYHFQHSSRVNWIFLAFLISSTLLLGLSFISTIDPRAILKSDPYYGVPVKNYIDQSQEFALCAVGATYLALQCQRRKRYRAAIGLLLLSGSFIANMLFVVVSRTTLVSMPIMFGVLVFLHLSRRGIALALGMALAIIIVAWFTSPGLRWRTEIAITQYQEYKASNAPTSVGLRLEFWKKSIEFFIEAPLIGHGTGSVESLFAKSAIGQTGASAQSIANPHNQTLFAAIQWGSLGMAVLFAMWLSHLMLFRGISLSQSTSLAQWIGFSAVIQNMLTSIFNSHLFDFHEGWMYVLGVGVAGGAVLSQSRPSIKSNDAERGSA